MVLETAVQTPQDVEAMRRLSAAGWGRRRIARELGCSHETVRKYLRQGGWQPYGKPCRNTVLDGQSEWLRQLLGELDLKGVLIQADALHTQRPFFSSSRSRGPTSS